MSSYYKSCYIPFFYMSRPGVSKLMDHLILILEVERATVWAWVLRLAQEVLKEVR